LHFLNKIFKYASGSYRDPEKSVEGSRSGSEHKEGDIYDNTLIKKLKFLA